MQSPSLEVFKTWVCLRIWFNCAHGGGATLVVGDLGGFSNLNNSVILYL